MRVHYLQHRRRFLECDTLCPLHTTLRQRHFGAILRTAQDLPHSSTRDTNWLQHLALVLICIRCALKKDLGFISSELVYGITPRLRGTFFTPHHDKVIYSPSTYINRYRDFFFNIFSRPVPARDSASIFQISRLGCMHSSFCTSTNQEDAYSGIRWTFQGF